jgi:hypothetical protein
VSSPHACRVAEFAVVAVVTRKTKPGGLLASSCMCTYVAQTTRSLNSAATSTATSSHEREGDLTMLHTSLLLFDPGLLMHPPSPAGPIHCPGAGPDPSGRPAQTNRHLEGEKHSVGPADREPSSSYNTLVTQQETSKCPRRITSIVQAAIRPCSCQVSRVESKHQQRPSFTA